MKYTEREDKQMGTIIGEGITFDDVPLFRHIPEVIPNQVDLTTYLTKSIKLNIPMMSSRNGYRYGASHGDRHGKTGRYRYYSQEYVD